MLEVSTVLVLLCLVTFLAFLTRTWSIPYPTNMVLVGAAIAFVPGLPHVQLTPEIVFLAAALAIPADFPFRTLILFVVFVVILGTLVVQGVSLPWLVRMLQLSGGGRSQSEQELDARLALLACANIYLDEKAVRGVNQNEIEYLRSYFRSHADSWLMRLNLEDESILGHQSSLCHKAFSGVLAAQRHRLHELFRQAIIEEALVQKLEREIDMEESRIKSIANAP